jgi:hypothetical protein
MKVAYCSLKDAFKSPDFYKNDEEYTLTNKELHTIPYTIPSYVAQTTDVTTVSNTDLVIKENFEDTCDTMVEHLKSCKRCSSYVHKSKPQNLGFSDLLNMILIILLIWIIIYKPNI